ncbi:MAG: methyltransferase domain-containing protein [Planctomycetota bacterium]
MSDGDASAGRPEKEYVRFPSREARSRWVATRFRPYLGPAVLDVGCCEAPLRALLTGVAYTGVDVAGDPDLRLDLARCERLPFADGAFPCVLCIEVLEHLENLHAMFDELVRVAARHVVVSLPNCWRDARRPIERGAGSFAHYGLPLDPPADRHRWFFGITAARAFLLDRAARHGLRVVELLATEPPRPWPVRALRRLRYPGERYENRYAQTVWAVYAKDGG